MQFRWFHNFVAFCMILCTIQAFGATTKVLVGDFIQVGMPIANSPYTGIQAMPEDLKSAADTLDAFVVSASKDGSLAALEAKVLANKAVFLAPPTEHAIDLAYARFQAHGWLGTREDAKTILMRPSPALRKTALEEIENVGLKSFLHNRANQLRQIALDMSIRQTRQHLINASYQLRLIDYCDVAAFDMDLMGGLAGVAALFGGPVNPVADALTILAGVGAGVWYFGGCDGTGV